MHYLLFYDYVADVVERRAPYRAAHLDLARAALERGELVMAGALANPVDGAVFVFQVDDPSTIEAFVASDPYVVNGLVTAWRLRQWTVAIGGASEARRALTPPPAAK